MRSQLNLSLQAMVARQTDEANKILTGLSSKIEEAVGKTGSAVEGQIKMLEDAQERELKKVMSEMGSALATITETFTKDYSKLVDAMNKVVTKN
jgi:phage host-nuclease inhibitor protein Gam